MANLNDQSHLKNSKCLFTIHILQNLISTKIILKLILGSKKSS